MAQRPALSEIRERTYKRRDAWWTVWLTDPIASRLVWLVAPWRWVTPNRLTSGAFVLGLFSAYAFWRHTYVWLLIGALVYQLSFVLDCMDGKIARLNGTGSVFGMWLDFMFDRLRVAICTVALFGGQYERTHSFVYMWLAALVFIADSFRYLNAAHMGKVKTQMKLSLAMAGGESAPVMFVEETDDEQPIGRTEAIPAKAVDARGVEHEVVDVYGDFREKFGFFISLRNTLLRQRVRAHLFSGIEFMMFVFIVGPLTDHVVPVTAGSFVLLGAFELLLIYKLWTATQSYDRQIAETLTV